MDHRPYEFIWDRREEAHEPLLDFEGLLGWTAEVEGTGRAALTRTDDAGEMQRMFDTY